MTRRVASIGAWLVALAGMLAAGPAAAAELSFTGTLEIQINVLPPFVVEADGVAEVMTTGPDAIGRIDLPGGVFVKQSLIVPVTDPSAAPIRGIALRDFANETAVFERDGSNRLGGSMPLVGQLRVCLFGPCSMAIGNITVPLSVVGQTASAPVSAAVALTVRGAPWTTQTVAVGTTTWMGSDGGLDLNLVTPVFVSTNIAPSAVVPVHGLLSFVFAAPGEHCRNQIDDDRDGATDHPADPGCESEEDSSERSTSAPCDNGADDDGDRRIDGGDPGCTGPADASERSAALVCDDEIDNDGDGAADEDDPGCLDPSDPSERGDFACENDLDDDGDGLTDGSDPGCSTPSDTSERQAGFECDDDVDGDLDGVADFPADPGCASAADPSERTAAIGCDDGLDNDGDGRNDFSTTSPFTDPGCASPVDASEKSPLFGCDDGLDNDFDGTRDVPEDPGCATPSDQSEQGPQLACDNGLDDDEDGAIDSQQDAGCTGPRDLREAIDFADGGYVGIGAAQQDDVFVDDGDGHFTALDVLAGGAIAGDLTAAGGSLVRVRGGAIEGSLVAQDHAEVELAGGAIGGVVEARDTAMITIVGTGFDQPLGIVTATSGTLAGFLADGSAFVWDFVRDPGAAIVLVPEPEAGVAALVALGALLSLRCRAPR